ncbi:hypothetical protein [Deinococcus aquaedulcis]|uniref:hypothetical protein n=1 Tax=Deinococcus aquaedulcis TaxID=2840455 RepID=UPI001C839FA9|nr:hypothetical protein [Deinococcus aquaedulcis]
MSREDETKHDKMTELLPVWSPGAVEGYQLGKYEAQLGTPEQKVAATKVGEGE